ncbi:interleukin-17F [Tiliqua scincoides]|uniref:interleukin-17F n=1 Tax=Tiliqua scincoides TaxID=71010 RepID=UPI0034636A7F
MAILRPTEAVSSCALPLQASEGPPKIHALMLVLTLMYLAHGKVIKQKRAKKAVFEKMNDNCPTQEDCKYPDCMNIHIGFSHKDSTIQRPQDVRNRSTSPWDYRINEDPDRFPYMISEANCRHHGCLNSQGIPDLVMYSVPIQQEILVIKRKQTGCRQTYWLEKQVVTVGCTCARPTTYASSG